jgi:hypothetical protein
MASPGASRNNVHEHRFGVTLQSLDDLQQFQHINPSLAALIVGNERLRLPEQLRQLLLG